MAELVVLMRAVNVGGRKLPMAELRGLCEKLGFDNPKTYIQSGNLLIDSGDSLARTGDRLGTAIAGTFDLKVPLIIRTAKAWQGYIAGNPFAGDKSVADKALHMLLAAKPPSKEAIAKLEEFAVRGERMRIAGDALWIDYAGGVGDSKLTAARLDKAWGATVTARNLRTVCKIQEMIEERAG